MRAAALGLLALVAACGELDRPVYAPRQAPVRPDTSVSSPVLQTPAPAPQPIDQAPADACGAKALAHLVGKNRSEIPVPVNPAQRRVACTTCPITEDYSPWRLNIFYDAKSGVITEVRCG
ncbi:MAG TPA: peptidase inhibitor I78 [Caulobacteraceae bacterium]